MQHIISCFEDKGFIKIYFGLINGTFSFSKTVPVVIQKGSQNYTGKKGKTIPQRLVITVLEKPC